VTTSTYPLPLQPGGPVPPDVRWPAPVAVRVFGAEAAMADAFVVDWQLAVTDDRP